LTGAVAGIAFALLTISGAVLAAESLSGAALASVDSTRSGSGENGAHPSRSSSSDPRSLVALAVAHEHGEGVPKDQGKAAALYCEAARAGDADALHGLGWMYANGRGMARDDAMAAALFALAAEAGNEQARRAVALVGPPGDGIPECLMPEDPLPTEATVDDEPDPFGGLPPDRQGIVRLVMKLAPRYAVDPKLALAVIAVESDFAPRARSVKDAQGLMQLIPETAARFNVRNPFDPQDNVKGGLAYLRWLLSYYRGQVALALAAYNAGERAVDRYGGIPPYAETREYVRKIRALFRKERHPYDPEIVDASPVLAPVAAGKKK
jgi:soluble lytic murein transglycosylase-like protein